MDPEYKEIEGIRLARKGNQEAFETLMIRYRGIVLALAQRILDDFHAAEDITQEVFLTAFRKLDSLNDEKSFGPWLKRITFTMCLRYAENCRKKQEELHAGDSGIFDPFLDELDEETDDWERYAGRIEQAVKNLSDTECVLLDMFYVKGLTHRQIAAFLQVPEGTVKRRLFDSRKSLQEGTLIPGEMELNPGRAREAVELFRKALKGKIGN